VFRLAALSFLVTALIFAAIGTVGYRTLRPLFDPAWGAAAAATSAEAMVGRAAPDFSLQDSVTGRDVRLSDYRGKTVVLNFWATWCGPCRFEMPALEQAYREHGGADVVVIAVNLRETNDEVAAFRRSLDLTFPMLMDRQGAVYAQYDGRVLPQTFFIDRNGVVRGKHVGGLGPADLARGVQVARDEE